MWKHVSSIGVVGVVREGLLESALLASPGFTVPVFNKSTCFCSGKILPPTFNPLDSVKLTPFPCCPKYLCHPRPSPPATTIGWSCDRNQPIEPLPRTICWHCYGDAYCLHLKPVLVGGHLCNHLGDLPKDEAGREDGRAMRWERPGPTAGYKCCLSTCIQKACYFSVL